MARVMLLRLCTANACWRTVHVTGPVDAVVGDADGALVVEAGLTGEPDADETSVATGGPGKVYWTGVSKTVGS